MQVSLFLVSFGSFHNKLWMNLSSFGSTGVKRRLWGSYRFRYQLVMDGCLSWSNWSFHANLNHVMMHLLWYSGWPSVDYDTNWAVLNMISQGVIADVIFQAQILLFLCISGFTCLHGVILIDTV